MKKSELEKKLAKISNHIRESELIPVLDDLAHKGNGKITRESFYTNHNFNFEYEDLRIKLDDGLTMMGGGEMEVWYNEKLVLKLNRNLCNKEYVASVNGWGIDEYHSGEWEKEIKKINKNYKKVKPEKKVDEIPKDPVVPEDILEKLKQDYDLDKF